MTPNELHEEATLHASCHYPVGTDEYHWEMIHYMALRIDHTVAPQVIRIMAVLYDLPFHDEEVDLICAYVLSDDYCPEVVNHA